MFDRNKQNGKKKEERTFFETKEVCKRQARIRLLTCLFLRSYGYLHSTLDTIPIADAPGQAEATLFAKIRARARARTYTPARKLRSPVRSNIFHQKFALLIVFFFFFLIKIVTTCKRRHSID